jgi:hypothetical protein
VTITTEEPTTTHTNGRPTRADLQARLTEAEAQIAALHAVVVERESALAEWDTKWKATWRKLGEEASRHDLCGVYDEVVTNIGGIPRYVRRTVSLTIAGTTQITEPVARRAGNVNRYITFELTGTSMFSWQMTGSTEVFCDPRGCACGEVNADEAAREWLQGQGIAFTDLVQVNYHCESNQCVNR